MDQNKEPYIFLSYSHNDKQEALEIIRALRNTGYQVWNDEGIFPGAEWDKMITENVEQCGFFISLISKPYLESSNCKDELNYAIDLDKPRLMIYLNEVQLSADMKMRMNQLQSIQKYEYSDDQKFYEKLFTTPGLEICRIKQDNH